jgi:hypothetical protein
MSSSAGELREHFLRDHAQLRGKADVLKSLALQVVRGDEDLGPALQLKGTDLQLRLIDHMRWEESQVAPYLRRIDRAAADLADHLFEEHQLQRERLAQSLMALSGAGPNPEELARHILDLVRWLERDMAEEETRLLAWLSEPGDSTGGPDARGSSTPSRA